LASIRVNASSGSLANLRNAVVRPASLSSDGKLLVFLMAVTLVGPYLPLFDWLDISTWASRSVRPDNLLLPAAAAYVAMRSLATGSLRLPVHVVIYSVFCAWLLLVTALWAGNVPAVHGGTPDTVSVVRGIDAYVRPLFVLFIAANVRVNRHDLMVILRLLFVIAIVLMVVAVAQLSPIAGDHLNRILADYYDNSGSETYFWNVLRGGRVSALMPQLSTLGMYMVLTSGLLGAQLLGARLVKSRAVVAILIVATLLGGILSGSKMFFVGLLLTIGLSLISWPRARRGNLGALGAVLALVAVAWIVATGFFPDQADRFAGRVSFSREGIWEQYIAPRFAAETGKVYRAGAVDIASDYPLTGLGLNAVGHTTDSLLLGLVVISGAVGTTLFLASIGIVVLSLHAASRTNPDLDLAGLATMTLILTVVFLVAAVGFHTFIQDRAGDAYWMIVGLLIGPLAARGNTQGKGNSVAAASGGGGTIHPGSTTGRLSGAGRESPFGDLAEASSQASLEDEPRPGFADLASPGGEPLKSNRDMHG